VESRTPDEAKEALIKKAVKKMVFAAAAFFRINFRYTCSRKVCLMCRLKLFLNCVCSDNGNGKEIRS